MSLTGRPAFRVSDRLIGRSWRLCRQQLAAHPYLAGSVLLHGALASLLLGLPGWGEAQRAKSAAMAQAEATQRIEQTELRDLQRRVQRMAQIRHLLDPTAAPATLPGEANPSPTALARQAQDLSASIDAAQRRWRAAELARLARLPLAEAARQLDAQAGAQQPATKTATPAETIAQLERRAQDSLAARRMQLAAQRDGVQVTRAAPAPAASGSTGQIAAAPGIPKALGDQLAAMARFGPLQGRVGVPGVADGLSVNPKGVQGVAGGRIASQDEPTPAGPRGNNKRPKDAGSGEPRLETRLAEAPPVTEPGSSIDLTAELGAADSGADRQHTQRVRYLRPPPVDAATLRPGAGRAIGPGGTFATRVYLDSWYLIGPFAGQGSRTLQTPYPPEQGDIDLDGAYLGLDGRLLSWRYTSRGFYPFIPPDPAERAVYYAYTELRVDEDRDVWLSIAADDDSMLWLDGRLIWTSERRDKPWYHPPYYLRDEQVASLALAEGHRRVHLQRGLHRLLFKLYNERERSFFSVVLAP